MSGRKRKEKDEDKTEKKSAKAVPKKRAKKEEPATPPEPALDEREVAINEAWTRALVTITKLEEDLLSDSPIKWPMEAVNEYMNLYFAIYELCTRYTGENNATEIEVHKRMKGHVREFSRTKMLPRLHDKHDEPLLHELVSLWTKYRQFLTRAYVKIFKYLDRFFLKGSAPDKKRGVEGEVNVAFRDEVFMACKDRLRGVVLDQIKADRDGAVSNRTLCKAILEVFQDMALDDQMKVYQEHLAVHVHKATEEYYARECSQWIAVYNLPEYLIKVDERLKEESARLSVIFPTKTAEELTKIVDKQLLAVPQKQLFENNSVGQLILDEKVEDLGRLFRLMQRTPHGSQEIAKIFEEHISSVGLDTHSKMLQEIKDEKDLSKMVKTLIDSYIPKTMDFFGRMEALTDGPFQKNSLFVKAMSEGFKRCLNEGFRRENSKSELKTAQIFAYYCDEMLRKKDEALEEKMDKIVKFLHHFKEKDIFIEEYRKQLSKRLLSGGQQEDENEKNCIAKLKYHHRGVGELYKLEKMLSDKSLSADLKQEFSKYVSENKVAVGMELSIMVLTTGQWPLGSAIQKDPFLPPQEFQRAQEAFRSFYTARNPSRLLNWLYSQSNAILDARFAKQKKILEVTTVQASVLLQFNDKDECTFGEVKEALQVTKEELLKSLLALTTKVPVLTCETAVAGKPREWTPDTKFKFNDKFTHKQVRIKVPVPRVTEEEAESTHTRVSEDRRCVLDAAIVRIMKTRKTMKIQELIAETMDQVKERFMPEARDIKKQMESLIEKEYLKRKDGDTNMMEYLA